MEMMIVLLIIAIVAAASAPMISKKMVRSTGNDSPWVWTTMTGTDIGFNLKGADASASIGAAKAPDTGDKAPGLYIKSKKSKPQILLADKNNHKIKLQYHNDTVWFTNEDKDDTPSVAASVVIGDRAISSANTTVAIGSGATSSSNGSVAIGLNSKSGGESTDQVAIGSGAESSNNSTVAVGYKAISKATRAIAIGSNITAENPDSIIIGTGVDDNNKTEAKSSYSIAMGYNAKAGTNSTDGFNTIAIGGNATASNNNAVAIGSSATAYNNSIAISAGDKAIAGSGLTTAKSIAIGHNVTAVYQGIAMGKDIKANMIDSIVVGTGCESSQYGYDSLVIGKNSWAKSPESIALGNTAHAGKDYSQGVSSVAIGSKTTASHNNSIAIGAGANAIHNNSVAIGPGATTTADNQIRLGVGPGSDGTGGTTVDIPGTFAVNNMKVDNINKRTVTSGSQSIIKLDSSLQIPAMDAGGSYVGILYTDNIRATSTKSRLVEDNTERATSKITIGNQWTTVHIPGNLIVQGSVGLGMRDDTKRVYTRMYTSGKFGALRNIDIRNGKNESDIELRSGGSWSDQRNTAPNRWYYYGESSDRRLKNVGEVFKGGLDEIKKLEVFNYTFKKDTEKTPRVGVMAQDLQKIFPKAVFKGEDGFLRIRMEDMFYAMVNAIKELDRKVEMLIENQKRITELEKELKDLRKDYDSLEKRIQKLEKKRWNKDVE